MQMIEVQGLTQKYRDRIAVDGLTFSLEAGEILGFLGPNGAGKSTTMKMLTGFLPPSSGTARIAGFDVFEDPLEVKRRIGYLPESPPLYTDMTVLAYLRFVATLKGIARSVVKTEVDRVMALTNTTSVHRRVLGNLSKGFRQRVGLAQALLGSPPLLILDEPTEGLDPSQRAEVRTLIRSLAGKHTVLLSTHILPDVTMTCEKVLILSQGKRVAFDRIEKLALAAGLTESPASLEEVFIKLTAA